MKRKSSKQLFLTLMVSFIFTLFLNPMICMAQPNPVSRNTKNTTNASIQQEVEPETEPTKKSTFSIIPKTGDPIINIAICVGLLSLAGVIICIVYKIRKRK